MLAAPLVIDMCGFTQRMAEDETPDKARAREAVYAMRDLGRAAIEAEGGTLVNAFADNLFAVMPSVRAAVRASEAIGALIPVSAGIGWGPLVIDGLDIWGDEMNAASDLGEEVAGRGEILLTEPAQAELINSARAAGSAHGGT